MRTFVTTTLFVITLLTSGVLSLSAVAAAPKTAKPTADAQLQAVMDQCAEILTGTPLDRYAHLSENWTLADLLNSDPSKNLAVLFPTILMNSDQRNWYVANYIKPRKIRDGAYRVGSYDYYPVVSEGIPEAGGKEITGHFQTIERAMMALKARASGKRSGKMVGFIGPSGTGKTELLDLLKQLMTHLAMNNPAYYRFTFEFVDLDKIPNLKWMVAGGDEGSSPATKNITLNRSPIVLLPPHLQQHVLKIATPAFREKLNLDPLPVLSPTRKTQKVIDEIIEYYARKERAGGASVQISDKDYLRYLLPHVRIVRQVYDSNQPTTIVRYLGKNPNLDALFFTEDMALQQFYGSDDPRSYRYGLIPSNDGEGLYVDEFFRQGPEVRDSMLDLAQNGIAQSNGSPAEKLDVTVMFATNDASIEDAKQAGSATAHLSRTVRLPMRHAIEPWYIAKIAINDMGAKHFKMKALKAVKSTDASGASSPAVENELIPYNAQKAFPNTEDGTPVGTDGNYALYYQPTVNEKPVLIAPRVAMMMGLTASSTRLVTDPAIYAKANQKRVEFHTYNKAPQFFTDPALRLQVLMGQVSAQKTTLAELQKARMLLKEGQEGIDAREVETWFTEALSVARGRGVPLTPVIMDEAFERLMNDGGVTTTAVNFSRWKNLHKLVKEKFILPALTADVLNILQGQGRVESIYDDIKLEMYQLSRDADSEYVEGEGNQRVAIDKQRLQQIYQIYLDNYGQEFNPGILKNFHLDENVSAKGQRHPQLLEAVRTWLAKQELAQTSISEIKNYYEGRPTSESARLRGAQSEQQLEAYGYDRYSFLQALNFVKETQFEVERMRVNPGE